MVERFLHSNCTTTRFVSYLIGGKVSGHKYSSTFRVAHKPAIGPLVSLTAYTPLGTPCSSTSSTSIYQLCLAVFKQGLQDFRSNPIWAALSDFSIFQTLSSLYFDTNSPASQSIFRFSQRLTSVFVLPALSPPGRLECGTGLRRTSSALPCGLSLARCSTGCSACSVRPSGL